MSNKIMFLYPYARDKTIGGVSSAQRPAEKWFADKGYEVISENYIGLTHRWFQTEFEKGCHTVVCCNKDYKLFAELNFIGYKIFLIGHNCCWVTFYNDPLDSGYQIKTIENFIKYVRGGIIDYIPLTENDAKLYKILFDKDAEVGINPPISRIPKLHRQRNERFTVGQIGRVAPEKNHYDLIKMAQNRLDWVWEYTDAYDPYYDNYYKSTTKKLESCANIVAINPKYVESVFWTGVDAIILPSIHEASPVVFFEALRRGIPVVSYDNITPDYDWFAEHNAIQKVPQGFYHDAIEALWDIKDEVETNSNWYDECYENFNAIVDHYYDCHKTWMQIIDERINK